MKTVVCLDLNIPFSGCDPNIAALSKCLGTRKGNQLELATKVKLTRGVSLAKRNKMQTKKQIAQMVRGSIGVRFSAGVIWCSSTEVNEFTPAEGLATRCGKFDLFLNNLQSHQQHR